MNSIGQIVEVSGNFTMLKYIEHLGRPELERTIGFDAGRLNNGFSLVVLSDDQLLTPSDIELKASSRWSKGAVGKSNVSLGVEIELLLAQRDQDVAALKQKVCNFFAKRGGNRPAKVLPNLRHTEGMRYPDAEASGPGKRGGVPQFNLTVARRFVVIRVGR